jgi:hypothetical protein
VSNKPSNNLLLAGRIAKSLERLIKTSQVNPIGSVFVFAFLALSGTTAIALLYLKLTPPETRKLTPANEESGAVKKLSEDDEGGTFSINGR